MKKKNMAKKAVLPALLAVLCSTAALTSVSYAWFTMGNEASVGQIDVNVQAADGLQISADAATWKSVLDVASLTAVSSNKLGDSNTELAPVSSVGTVTGGVQEIFYAEKQLDESLKGKVAVAGVDYLMFDLYVKVDSGKKLSLTKDATVTGLSGSDKDSELSSRVSFVDLGSMGIDSTYVPNKITGSFGSDVSSTAVIWEPNSTQHTPVALGAGATAGEKDEYQGIASVAEPATGESLGVATLSQSNVQTTDNSSDIEVATLEAGVNKIRVYIWLEGQDLDCTNEVSGSKFGVNLKFSVPKQSGSN